MKFEINFLDNLKEFGIFIFALLLVFPVNILISNDNQISISFVSSFDYAYITRENMYLAMPCSFILLPFFIFNFFLDLFKSKIFSGHKTLLFFFNLILLILIICIFYFIDLNIRLVKNLISLNILIFLLFYSKIFFKNFSYKTIDKVIFFSVFILSLVCLTNLFSKILFYAPRFDIISKSSVFYYFNISHYQDYFPYVVFLCLGLVLFLQNRIFNLKEKIYYSLIFLLWLFESIIYDNKGLLFVFIFSLSSLIFYRFTLIKNFIISNLYFFYLPLILMFFFTIFPLIYGLDRSLDERFRLFSRNYSDIENVFFPLINKSMLEFYANIHNDFLDIFTLYGLFSFFVFNLIYLKLRKIIKHNFLFGFLLIGIYFLGSLVQNNLLNPYFLIIFCLILSLNSKDYLNRI